MFLWYPFFLGPSILILLPAIALAIYAQWKVRSTYARYARIPSSSRISAQRAAERILETSGITDVTIEETGRPLGDQYDPRTKTLRLSAPDSPSIAAIGVAAHEAGHAIQHARGFAPLALAVLFTLVTLPVEFDASRRAVAALRETAAVSEEELGGVKEVLFAAALTYVAAAAMAALQLLMLLSASRRR